MSFLTQFLGGERVSALVGKQHLSPTFSQIVLAANAIPVLSGAMTANTLKTALSVSGRGKINWAAVYANDGSARTLRMRVTIDGLVVLDSTSASFMESDRGFVGIGAGKGTSTPIAVFQPLRFQSSLLIELASNVTETDKATFAYNYEVFV